MAFIRLRSIGTKLFGSIALPAILVAVGGIVFYWHQADQVIHEATQNEASALSEILSNTFELADRTAPSGPGTREISSHRAVTEATALGLTNPALKQFALDYLQSRR